MTHEVSRQGIHSENKVIKAQHLNDSNHANMAWVKRIDSFEFHAHFKLVHTWSSAGGILGKKKRFKSELIILAAVKWCLSTRFPWPRLVTGLNYFRPLLSNLAGIFPRLALAQIAQEKYKIPPYFTFIIIVSINNLSQRKKLNAQRYSKKEQKMKKKITMMAWRPQTRREKGRKLCYFLTRHLLRL